MKTTFFSRNVGIVVWMAVVLVLGVQGTAEAVTKLERTSPEELSIRVGDPFEVNFRVTLQSQQIIKSGNQYYLEGDGSNDFGDLVNSSGYKIGLSIVDGKYYILPDASHTPSGTAIVGTRHTYLYTTLAEQRKGENTGKQNSIVSPEPSGSQYYVDTAGNVKDGRGRDVYIQTGTGRRADSESATPQSDPFKYVRDTIAQPTKQTDSSRYYYNDEAITVISPTLVLRLPNDFPVSGQTLSETDHRDSRLQSTMTLTGRASAVGTFPITIINGTSPTDYPLGSLARTLAGLEPKEPRITFTVRVSALTASAGGRVRTTRNTESVSNQFKADDTITVAGTEVPPNTDIIYRVTRGSGTLFYAGHTPTTTLTVHKDTDVYININGTDNTVEASVTGEDHIVKRQSIVFEYIGTDPRTTPTSRNTVNNNQDNQQTTPSITASRTSISGAPNSDQALTLSAGTTAVRLQGSASFISAGGSISGSGTSWSVRLPNTPGSTYQLTASASGYLDRTISVTVAAPLAPGTLAITTVGARSGTQQQIRVTASGRPIPSAGLSITLVGVSFPRTITIPSGSASVPRIVTLPDATSAHTVYATATGYNPSNRLTIPAPTATTTTDTTTTATTTTTTTTVSEPESVSIVGPSQRDGTANTELDAALIVQVLDDDGDAVADARVIFRVRTGQGRLSERGNGRAVAVQTDSQGYGRATYTPMSASSTVEAEVRGVTRSVEFTITASGGTATTPRETGTGTTPSTTIRPVVHVGAAQRPPMVWVDGGAIYALVGANVQKFASGVENAQNLAIGGNKVYWTEKTGASAGTINSANLDGSNVKQLTAIMAVPMGIAVDMAGSKLYWTNSRGRIQSANLDGSGITNVLQNLTSPLDIALAGGNVYWTHANGGVGFVNLRGQKQVRHISNGANAAGSLAIAGGKVYWTEQTGDTGGTINSANLNGSGVTELASIQATPIGIAVDTARSKLFWTNSRGRVQSAALDGSGIQNVVTGLGMPGDMVLSNSITAPATTTPTTPTTAAKGKYDVNGDGMVDGRDKVLVLDAVMAGTYVAKYDVNDDKKLDILDYVLVDVAVDTGAAGAPALLGMKLSAIQIDVLQEQIDLLIATNDRSPAAMRTLIYLQQLIATARPEQTQLLANYPNPFNPETWIPYELATDTDVRLTIYNTHGVVIRTLELGHQSAGYYTGRDRAAYWDGRNAFGEQVASGIYFYQLETDTLSSLRKMVILK